MPEISVIIPSYNHAAYIGFAVESVLSQSLSDLELIVVDDGSTDNSLDILSEFSDKRLQVLTQTNQGAHIAINRGLEVANGRYLAILNSDDAYHPLRLEKITQVLQKNPQIGLAGSFIDIIDQDGKYLGIKHGYTDGSPWQLETPERSFRAGNDFRKALLTENYYSTTSNFVFSKQWFDTVGRFSPLRYAHDWDFALRMARVADIFLLPESLMSYRVHATNTIRSNRATMIFEICWCLAVHIPQYLNKPNFLDTSFASAVDELLNSIYTFGLERVLTVMLLQRLHENPDMALELLSSENLTRATYLGFIQRELNKESLSLPQARSNRQSNLVARLLEKLRKGNL